MRRDDDAPQPPTGPVVDLASILLVIGGVGGGSVVASVVQLYRAKSEKRATDASADESIALSAQSIAAAAAQAAGLIRGELERVEAGWKADRARIEQLERLLRRATAALIARGIAVPSDDDLEDAGDG